MAEIMKVQCYKCQTVYDIPEDMAGQLVECAVCSVTFAVPAPIPGREDQILATFPYVNFNETSVDVRADAEQDAQKPSSGGSEATSTHDTADASAGSYQDTSTKTKTVKLSRSNFGMIPAIEGETGIGTITVEKKHHAASTVARKKQDEFVSSGQTVPAKPAPAKPSSPRKWWQFWR